MVTSVQLGDTMLTSTNRLLSWVPRRKHVEPGMRRCLYVANEAIEVPNGETPQPAVAPADWQTDVTTWAADDGPNWFLYDLLILEVPRTANTLDRYRLELEEARASSTIVVWILSAAGDPAVASTVCESEVIRPRQPISPPPADATMAEYLATVASLGLAVRPPAGAKAVAPLGSARLWAGGFLRDNGSVRAALPKSSKPPTDTASLIQDGVWRPLNITQRSSDWRAFHAFVALTLCVVGMTTWLRYSQRDFNQNYAVINGLYTTSFLANRESNDPVGKLIRGQASRTLDLASKVETAKRPRDIQLLYSLGLFQHGNRAMDAWLKSRERQARCGREGEVALELGSLAERSLDAGNVPQARMLAQMHINLTNRLGCGQLDRPLSQSQAILDLTRSNHVAGSSLEWTRALLWPGFGLDTPELPSIQQIDPSLKDNLAYATIVREVVSGGTSPDVVVEKWLGFVEQHPTSDRVDEALFNALIAKMKVHRWSARHSEAEWLQANRETLPLVDRFLSKHPSSYLADDAALLGLRVSAVLRQRETAERYLKSLTATRTSTDALVELEARLGERLLAFLDGAQAHRAAELCADPKVLVDEGGALPEGLRVVAKMVPIEGRGARDVALDVMMKAFAETYQVVDAAS
jgi:hypothetical protein